MSDVPFDHVKFMRSILEANKSPQDDFIGNIIKAVNYIIPYKMCSVWKINNKARAVSLRFRYPINSYDATFTHDIQGSLIGKILKYCENENVSYYESENIRNDKWYSFHQYKGRVDKHNLKKFLSIPIPNSDHDHKEYKYDAVLNVYPIDSFCIDSNSTIEFLRDQISFALSNERVKKREGILLDIIDVYKNRRGKDINSILHPIVHKIFPKYLNYEGCSLFIWDPFYNVLSLSQTTGIEGSHRKSEVSYQLGEGLTGYTSQRGQYTIIKDLQNIEQEEFRKEYEHLFAEVTSNRKTSFMALPIKSPSEADERLGVLRFTNRLNSFSNTIDYFSKEDLDLVNYAVSLLALYIDNYQSNRKNSAFAAQLAHEINTPTISVLASVRRLIRNVENQSFLDRYLRPYLKTIMDNTDLQSYLTESIAHLWKRYSDNKLSSKYQISKISVSSAIRKSKDVVKSICRRERILFDSIVIRGDDFFLWFDEFALRQIFFNLLTNAIKYRVASNPEDFRVKIKILKKGKFSIPISAFYGESRTSIEQQGKLVDKKKVLGHMVQVEDFGVGISTEEKDKVFIMGYRKKGIEKTNVRGLGIGLTVVKSLLDDFDCYIWISKLSNPTRFNIVFPHHLTNTEVSDDFLDR